MRIDLSETLGLAVVQLKLDSGLSRNNVTLQSECPREETIATQFQAEVSSICSSLTHIATSKTHKNLYCYASKREKSSFKSSTYI